MISEATTKRLVVVKLDQIGDYILFRNFLEILKKNKKYERCELILLGNKDCKDLAEKLDKMIVDDFIWLDKPRFAGWKLYRKRFLAKLRRMHFDILVSPLFSRENCWTEPVVEAISAKEKIGSIGDLTNITAAHKFMADDCYTRLIPARAGVIFEFLRNKEFFEALLGQSIDLRKPKIDVAPFSRPVQSEYAVLFPGAKGKYRRWPEENFAQIADYLSKQYQLTTVICGSREDKPQAVKVIRLASTQAIKNLCGKTRLGALPEIFYGSRLVITNDTSAHHIAAAVGVKTICLSNGNTFGRFVPYPPEVNEHVAYAFPAEIEQQLHNYNELVERYRYASRLDMDLISVDRVKMLINESLNKGRGQGPDLERVT